MLYIVYNTYSNELHTNRDKKTIKNQPTMYMYTYAVYTRVEAIECLS